MNRLITRSILAFVATSLAATLLPLLEVGGGRPILPVLDRSGSFVVYAGFLLSWLALVGPGWMLADPKEGRCWPWTVMAGLCCVFATIPLVFTAYISGVSAAGVLRVASMVGAAATFPIACVRLLRRPIGGVLARLVAVTLLFVLPLLSLYLRTHDAGLPVELENLSPFRWLHRIAVQRLVPPLWPFAIAAGIPCALALFPKRRPRAAVLPFVFVLGFALPLGSGDGAAGVVPSADLRCESRAGGVARVGFRTPLRFVTVPPVQELAISLGGVTIASTSPNGIHDVLVLPRGEERRARVELPDGVVEVALPFELVGTNEVLVAYVRNASDPSPSPPAVEGVRAVLLDAAALPLEPGALEVFDLVVSEARVAPERSARRAAFERYAALGGRVLLVDPTSPVQRIPSPLPSEGSFAVVARAPAERAEFGPPRLRDGGSADPDLVRTFAPPGWQELDLSSLLFFTVVYHLAFGLAFLLPMLLDSRKSLGVYLASVGFVVLVVAVLAWKVLGAIFLRDNQVYSQSMTMIVASEHDGKVGLRQFLAFASMSGEILDLSLPRTDDFVVVSRGSAVDRARVAFEDDRVTLRGAELDRFAGKLVLRRDGTGELPFALSGSGERLSWRRRAGVLDPLGIGELVPIEASEIADGRVVRTFRIEGESLLPVLADERLPVGPETEAFFRRVTGHFVPAWPRYLILRLSPLPRPDGDATYFLSRDLGTFCFVPWPKS